MKSRVVEGRSVEHHETHIVPFPFFSPTKERDLGDEYGWKQVHGDVFRPPDNIILFSSLLGTGYQLGIVALLVVLFIIIGDLYEE